MFISEFSGDVNLSLAVLTMLVCLRVNYLNKIDGFANGDGDGSNGFEIILQYFYIIMVFVPQALLLSLNLSHSSLYSDVYL